MPKVLVGCEFWIVALRLEYYADMAPEPGRVCGGVESLNDRSPARRKHEGREDSKQGRLSAAVRAEQSKKLGIPDVEGDAIEGGAVLVTVDEVLYADDCGLGARRRT